MNNKKPKPFDRKLSLRLDDATVKAERGNEAGKLRKRILERLIFGGNHAA